LGNAGDDDEGGEYETEFPRVETVQKEWINGVPTVLIQGVIEHKAQADHDENRLTHGFEGGKFKELNPQYVSPLP
jgi:hypothetical protein